MCGSRWTTAYGWPRRSTGRPATRRRACWRRCPTARTTSRPATRPSTSGSATSTATRSAGSTCAAPVPVRASPTDEYPEREQDDLVAVIAWLAAQPWCTGNVGMFGTSYSGFNSIQVAMRRPPALKAIVPIYATDDRYTDDVHYMGGARRLLDIIDYPTYMVAMNALPPVPAVFGDGLARRVAASARRPRTLAAALDRGADDSAVLAARLAAARLRRDHRRHHDRRRLGGRLPQQHLPDVRRPERRRHPGAADRRAVEPHVGRHRAARPAHRPRGRDGPLVRPLAARRRHRHRRQRRRPPAASRRSSTSDARRRRTHRSRTRSSSPAPGTAETTWPSPRLSTVEHRLAGGLVAHRLRPDTGTAAWNSCAGTLPYGQPTDQRFDDAASLTWDVVVTEPTELLGHAVLALRVAADRPVASVVGAAVRRRAGRHLDPDHPRAAQPDPRRRPRRRRPAAAGARRVRRRRGRAGGDRLHRAARPPAAARRDRRGLAQHRSRRRRR